jgi:hypothetical protein
VFLVLGAPKGSTLEVPYWDCQNINDEYHDYPFRLFLNSNTTGEISVYIISDK